MIVNALFGSLAVLGLVLLLWQWVAAIRFPLHHRNPNPSFAPPITLFKPLKGCDAATEDCLRSWFAQNYGGSIQILFVVASSEDPVCPIVRKLIREFPSRDAELIVVGELIGANAKISKLAQVEPLAKHDFLMVSDADVRVPADFLSQAILPLAQSNTGLVNCFYRLANPATVAMHWEAIAINADFWSHVLQSKTLKPLDFALGAAMLLRREHLREIGGFRAIADCLADDYQLGNRIAQKGHEIALCPIVVECWDPPLTWRQVWKHQLRWARTIRVCQPAPYFLSILSNAGWWAILWLGVQLMMSLRETRVHLGGASIDMGMPIANTVFIALFCLVTRILVALDLERRLTRSTGHWIFFWLVPVKDLLQTAVWFCAFAGNTVEWRGQSFRLNRDGTLKKRD